MSKNKELMIVIVVMLVAFSQLVHKIDHCKVKQSQFVALVDEVQCLKRQVNKLRGAKPQEEVKKLTQEGVMD